MLERRQVQLPTGGSDAGGTTAVVKFVTEQAQVGRWVYQVRVEPDERESLTDDNARSASIEVIDAKLRVLLLAGSPSWEYRLLSRLLTRDQTVELSCWLQSADAEAVRDGNTIIDHLPQTREELFAYDVLLLLDPDSTQLSAEWWSRVATAVSEHGAGLLLSAARLHTPALMRDPAAEPLIRLLPVTPDPQADVILNQIGHYQDQPWPVQVPDAALDHPIMQLADQPAANRLAWQSIGDIYWHYPVLREKPTAIVLLRHSHPQMSNSFGSHVLAAVGLVGSGRTAFSGLRQHLEMAALRRSPVRPLLAATAALSQRGQAASRSSARHAADQQRQRDLGRSGDRPGPVAQRAV